MRRFRIAMPLAALVGLALAANSALATFHQWDINEIFTNHDGTVQFIELKTPASFATGENFLFGHTLKATSTVGGVPMPTVTYTFPNANPVSDTGNKHWLIATPLFQTLAGSVTPNYNTLPANFFVPNADSILFSFAEGQDNVTIAGSAIPKDGVNSVTDANLFGVANFVASVNSPTNFAGQSGSINVPPPPVTTGDYNGDLTVDAADYTVWRDAFGQAAAPNGSGADGDADGTIDGGDYDFWKLHFGEVIGGAGGGGIAAAAIVPEPAALALSIPGILALILAAVRARLVRVRL